jgi:aspartate 1-decarboxylase
MNVKFIVGTSQKLIVFENSNPIYSYSGDFYGITFNKDTIFACARDLSGTIIHEFDKNFELKHKTLVVINSVHQALFDIITEKVFITHTRQDRLAIWDPISRKILAYHKWHEGPDGNDFHHINSIFRNIDGDNKLYVYEHNVSDYCGTDGNKHIGGVIRLSDKFQIEKIFKMGKQGHNVYISENKICIVDSFNEKRISRILEYDIKNTKFKTLISMPEYDGFAARGLAISDDLIIIGLTRLASRATRKFPSHKGFVIIYNRNNFEKLKEIEISGIGQVYEIRLLGVKDYAHNQIEF